MPANRLIHEKSPYLQQHAHNPVDWYPWGADAFDKADNRVSVMLPYLPIELADPLERLQAVHSRLARTKSSGQRQAGSAFFAAANYIPFAWTAWTVRLLTRLPQLGIVTLATNVPGPRHRMSIMGRRVVRLLPIPPIALQLRTGIAMLSYGEDLVFGVTADYDAVPDVDELAHGIERAVARLVAISEGPGGRDGGVVAEQHPEVESRLAARVRGLEETAAALDVSTQTVLRDWSLAKAWLRREMAPGAV